MEELFYEIGPNFILPFFFQLSKKNDFRPFENATQLEFFCKKTDSSLFAFGNHTKKRPDNLVISYILCIAVLAEKQYQDL